LVIVDSIEYLYVYNHNIRSLDFYPLADSSSLSYRVAIPRGSKAPYQRVTSYYIAELDSIYIFDGSTYGYKIVDRNLNILFELVAENYSQELDKPDPSIYTQAPLLKINNNFFYAGISWHLQEPDPLIISKSQSIS